MYKHTVCDPRMLDCYRGELVVDDPPAPGRPPKERGRFWRRRRTIALYIISFTPQLLPQIFDHFIAIALLSNNVSVRLRFQGLRFQVDRILAQNPRFYPHPRFDSDVFFLRL